MGAGVGVSVGGMGVGVGVGAGDGCTVGVGDAVAASVGEGVAVAVLVGRGDVVGVRDWLTVVLGVGARDSSSPVQAAVTRQANARVAQNNRVSVTPAVTALALLHRLVDDAPQRVRKLLARRDTDRLKC